MQESRHVSRYALAAARLGSPEPEDYEEVVRLLVAGFDDSAPFVATQWGFPYWAPFRRDPRILDAIARSGIAVPGPEHFEGLGEGVSDG